MFRSRGEHERAIRVHQALALRERDRRKLRQRAMYELGLDFRAAGMPRRATRAMEEVLLEEPGHEGALRALAALYEEQARFNEAAGLWQRLGTRRGEDTRAPRAPPARRGGAGRARRDDLESAKQLLKAAQKLAETAHFFAAAAELAAARGNHRGAKERLQAGADRRAGARAAPVARLDRGRAGARRGREAEGGRAARGRRADGAAGARRRSPTSASSPRDGPGSGSEPAARAADGRARFPTTSRRDASASACWRCWRRSRRRPGRGSSSR